MNRRAEWHDYNQPGTYMLTLVVNGRRPLFGTLAYEPEPHIVLSALGNAIIKDEIRKLNEFYPMIEVWQACMMPDHIHMIIRVASPLPPNKHLGTIIGAFKGGCTRAWRKLAPTAAIGSNTLFEEGYNDKILLDDGQLEGWKHYLDDNPRRLAIKRHNPDLFIVKNDILLEGMKCQCIGNMFLLNIPDKMEVIVHRADSDAEYERKFRDWMACGERGGVLVSASIAKREKMVMREAMNRGYNIILLREMGFLKLYKPGGEAFDACARGRLLELSPWEHHYDRRVITRQQCLNLNALATAISRNKGLS